MWENWDKEEDKRDNNHINHENLGLYAGDAGEPPYLGLAGEVGEYAGEAGDAGLPPYRGLQKSSLKKKKHNKPQKKKNNKIP